MKKYLCGWIVIGAAAGLYGNPSGNSLSERILSSSQGSVLSEKEEKLYLDPQRIQFFNDHYFLLSDNHQWIPLKGLSRDQRGFYIPVVKGS